MWPFTRRHWFAAAKKEAAFRAEVTAEATWYEHQNILPGDKALRKNLIVTRLVLAEREKDARLYAYRLLLLRRLARVNRKIMDILGLPDDVANNWRMVCRGISHLDPETRKRIDLLYRQRQNFRFQIESLRNPFRSYFMCEIYSASTD